MPNPFLVSRRKAAIVIAGSLVAAGPSATTRVREMSVALQPSDEDAGAAHHHILRLLKTVRTVNAGSERATAFASCKSALQAHDLQEASADSNNGVIDAQPSTLYRYADPTTVLAKVIVRELDAWPTSDHAGWLERFTDLEAAFRTHVTQQTAANVHRRGEQLAAADQRTVPLVRA